MIEGMALSLRMIILKPWEDACIERERETERGTIRNVN